MSSFASVKGPSTMVRFPPENLMRVPFELGWRPARSSSTPAFINSSLYLAILESSSSLGILPASESLLAFTIIMNFMVVSPCAPVRPARCSECKSHTKHRNLFHRLGGARAYLRHSGKDLRIPTVTLEGSRDEHQFSDQVGMTNGCAKSDSSAERISHDFGIFDSEELGQLSDVIGHGLESEPAVAVHGNIAGFDRSCRQCHSGCGRYDEASSPHDWYASLPPIRRMNGAEIDWLRNISENIFSGP